MAEEKKDAAEGEEAKKKSPIMPLIFVAVGAALGGGGVVTFTKPPEHHGEKPVPKRVLKVVHHPDELKFVFNPVKTRGNQTARIGLKFDYIVDEEYMEDAFELIKTRWDRATSRCLEVLMTFSAQKLKTSEGKLELKKRLVDELTMELFPLVDGKDNKKVRIARVEDIVWTEFFMQS